MIRHALYRLKWHAAKYFNFSAPVHVDIELTARCNLQCSFCHREKRTFEIGDMGIQTRAISLWAIVENKIKSVKFNWRGESLLSPYLYDAALFCKGHGIETMINTNLAVGRIDFLALSRSFDVIKVSLDSAVSAIYEEIRKGARYALTLNNLVMLCASRKADKKNRVIVSRRETRDTEAREIFIDRLKGFFVNFEIRPALKRNDNDIYIEQNRKRKYCGHPSRRLTIGWDGDVFACCVAYNEPEELRLGNIRENSLADIWNSAKRKALVENLKRGVLPGPCKNCTSKDAYK